MKKVLIISLISLISLVASCCSKLFPSQDDYLTIQKTPYTSDAIRIDGFYYQKWDNGTKYSNIVFLYNNGVIFQGNGAGDMSELVEYVNSTFLYHDMKKDKKAFWGLFLVKSNKIVYERWEGSQLGYLVYREEGEILNDTTFIMTEVSRMNQGEKTETEQIERTYYFHQFSPKPDSTNNVIP
jgi:hypothetical protein